MSKRGAQNGTLSKRSVLEMLYRHSPINKAAIARKSGLSLPTVMKITDELTERGLVKEIGKGASSGGKPPQLLEFVWDAHAVIGVDIGTTNISCIAMNLRGAVLARNTTPTRIDQGAERVIQRVMETVEHTLGECPLANERLLGIGLGIPGLLNPERGTIIFSPDFMWENVDISGPFKRRFGVTPHINNVSRAMAMGEKWFGIGHNVNNFLIVNLGYGIGSALVLGGEIYSGTSGSSGELGHVTVERNGPVCDCGNYGCLEAVASANAIVKKARNYLERGMRTALATCNLEDIDAKRVFDTAKQGDALALEIVNDAIDSIGTVLANYVNVMDPEMIILGGGMSNAGVLLTGGIETVMRRHQMKHAGSRVRVVQSQLGLDAAAVGSAAFLIKKLIETGGDAGQV